MNERHRRSDNHPTTVVIAFEHTWGQDVAASVTLTAFPIKSHLHAYGLPQHRSMSNGDTRWTRDTSGEDRTDFRENLKIPSEEVREGCRP